MTENRDGWIVTDKTGGGIDQMDELLDEARRRCICDPPIPARDCLVHWPVGRSHQEACDALRYG